MTLPGETVGTIETECFECQRVLNIEVLCSAAGYYIGFFCLTCGPYSRESGYYKTSRDAKKALNNDTYFRL